jgi:hypothetical protein
LLVDLSSTASSPPTSLSIDVIVPGQATITRALRPALPGTLLILLPDESVAVTLDASAGFADGAQLSASAVVQSIVHTQQRVSLSFGQAALDLGQLDLTGPTPDLSSMVIAHDDFQRADQAMWGTASDGQKWGSDADSSTAFAIKSEKGTWAGTSGIESAVLGPTVADAELVMSGSSDSFATSGNFGPALRWTDSSDFYKLSLQAADVQIIKRVAGDETVLGQAPRMFSTGTLYSFRFRAVGTMIMGKIWPGAMSEPSAWDVSVVDSSLSMGRCGLRPSGGSAVPDAGVQTTTITITTFTATRL